MTCKPGLFQPNLDAHCLQTSYHWLRLAMEKAGYHEHWKLRPIAYLKCLISCVAEATFKSLGGRLLCPSLPHKKAY